MECFQTGCNSLAHAREVHLHFLVESFYVFTHGVIFVYYYN